MTFGKAPICVICKHFLNDKDTLCCDAFPDKIPENIIMEKFIHTKPYPGDNGITFEQK
jgi:hypothetical protein